MRRRRFYGFLGFVLFCGAILFWQLAKPFSQPRYQAKPLAFWLAELNLNREGLDPSDPVYARVAQAQTALVAMGTDAMPWLVEFCTGSRGSLWRTLQSYLQRVPVIRERMERWEAGHPLSQRREMAARAFVLLGERSVPSLLSLAKTEDSELRQFAIGTLRALGAQAAGAWPGLLELQREAHPAIRESAISLLGEEVYATPETVSLLITVFADDPVDYVRQSAARSLAKHGKLSIPAVPVLLEGLTNAATRLWAAHALGQIGRHGGGEVVPGLRRLLSHADPGVQGVARMALEELGQFEE